MEDFLITYHRKSGEVHVRRFTNPDLALEWRIALERQHTGPHEEVALISSDSLDKLKRSHSRYFMRGKATIEDVDENRASRIL
ncbi:hypothetical protein [Corynebacterium cystitidis]|uniref:hypothetical protein n=1 Tax=Corynebacterium cystitidis TaxID=35757 RepID=UPI00211E5D53|nr:hypothetical protein [Corynebacterium cystitidis]